MDKGALVVDGPTPHGTARGEGIRGQLHSFNLVYFRSLGEVVMVPERGWGVPHPKQGVGEG